MLCEQMLFEQRKARWLDKIGGLMMDACFRSLLVLVSFLTIWKCFFLGKLPLFRFFRWTNEACLYIRIIDNSPALGATILLFCSTWTIFLILTVAKHPREISDLVTSLFTAWNSFTQDTERCWSCLRIQILVLDADLVLFCCFLLPDIHSPERYWSGLPI